jgi:hypothetical protein
MTASAAEATEEVSDPARFVDLGRYPIRNLAARG